MTLDELIATKTELAFRMGQRTARIQFLLNSLDDLKRQQNEDSHKLTQLDEQLHKETHAPHDEPQ